MTQTTGSGGGHTPRCKTCEAITMAASGKELVTGRCQQDHLQDSTLCYYHQKMKDGLIQPVVALAVTDRKGDLLWGQISPS